MKKISHSISGAGFQCSMEKVIVTTHTSMLSETIEPVTLSASDFWYMVHMKRCRDKQMLCDGQYCSYKTHIKPTYRWLESILHEDYSCRITPRIVSAKQINDNLFGSSEPTCVYAKPTSLSGLVMSFTHAHLKSLLTMS